jgi:hypothetical protein
VRYEHGLIAHEITYADAATQQVEVVDPSAALGRATLRRRLDAELGRG